MDKKIHYTLTNGKKISVVKSFRNLQHFDNYYNKLIKSGCNVYKIDEINPFEELAKQIFNVDF